MDASTIIFGAVTAASLGGGIFGASSALRNLSLKDFQNDKKDPKSDISSIRLKGQSRETNCQTILRDGTIRLRNGGYLRGYLLSPKPSLHWDVRSIENLYDRLALMLRTKLPEKAAYQFRVARHKDRGQLLNEIEIAQSALNESGEVDGQAALLKQQRINFYRELGEGGYFHRNNHTLWIYIPVKLGSDKLHNPISTFFDGVQRDGLFAGIKSLKATDSSITARLVEEEKAAYKQANELFRRVESVSPVKLKPLNVNETRQVLYSNYNENADSIPRFPENPRVDLKSVILNENIRANENWYLMHGQTPVTIINLFNLPESDEETQGCYAGMMRALSVNPSFTSRHTLITEYIVQDKDKMKANLKGKIKSSKKNAGIQEDDEEKSRAIAESRSVKRDLTSDGKNLIQIRLYVIVYGEPAFNTEELKESTDQLKIDSELIIKTFRESLPGSDASLEEPEALRAIYEKTLIGNLDPNSRGREFIEECESLACFTPLEDSSKGNTNPHSFFVTTTGKLMGLNVFRHPLMSIPSILILGESRSGKSVLASVIVEDILASVPNARVIGCDNGESLKPLTEMLGGRHLAFDVADPKTINIWDYPQLEDAIQPSEAQIDFVVEDTMILLGINETSEKGAFQKSIIRKCVAQVYINEVPRNKPGVRRHEPKLSHLVQRLYTGEFSSPEAASEAKRLAERLSNYKNNPWLDAPTHETFREDSKLDVFELNSLGKEFSGEVKRCLAYRVGATMHRAIGKKYKGQIAPLLILFDECHKFVNDPDLNFLLKAGETATRQGGKEGVCSIFITHRYEDISMFQGITENISAVFVGRQNNIEMLQKDRGWNTATAEAVKSLQTEKGVASQFVFNYGKGDTQSTEVVQIYLDPLALWSRTSDRIERNARALVQEIFLGWTMFDTVSFLAEHYPRGLVSQGLEKVDDKLLNRQRLIETEKMMELEAIEFQIAEMEIWEANRNGGNLVVTQTIAAPFAETIGLNLTEFQGIPALAEYAAVPETSEEAL